MFQTFFQYFISEVEIEKMLGIHGVNIFGSQIAQI